jgi:hypothetical protein
MHTPICRYRSGVSHEAVCWNPWGPGVTLCPFKGRVPEAPGVGSWRRKAHYHNYLTSGRSVERDLRCDPARTSPSRLPRVVWMYNEPWSGSCLTRFVRCVMWVMIRNRHMSSRVDERRTFGSQQTEQRLPRTTSSGAWDHLLAIQLHTKPPHRPARGVTSTRGLRPALPAWHMQVPGCLSVYV